MNKTRSDLFILAFGTVAGLAIGYALAYGRKEKLIQTICEKIKVAKLQREK